MPWSDSREKKRMVPLEIKKKKIREKRSSGNLGKISPWERKLPLLLHFLSLGDGGLTTGLELYHFFL